jgi:hypothetical protein
LQALLVYYCGYASKMPTEAMQQPTMIERVERALVLLAYFIELDGDEHLAMYELFERELTELRLKDDVRSRARQRWLAFRQAKTCASIPSEGSFERWQRE